MFDARAWQVPSMAHAVEALKWREADATKNSIAMAARAHFTHDQLLGKCGSELHELLHSVGVNWNDYPVHFKRGVYLRWGPTGVEVLEMSPIVKVTNAVEVIQGRELPVTRGAE